MEALTVLSAPGLAVLALIIWSCVVGARAYRMSKRASGDAAWALRLLALNLCEPAAGTPLVLGTLMLLRFLPLSAPWQALLVVWPMWALLAPAVGLRLRDPQARHVALRTFWLGLGRLACNALSLGLVLIPGESGPPDAAIAVAALVLPPISVALLLTAVVWGRRQLAGPMLLAASPIPAPSLPATSAARPAAGVGQAVPVPKLVAPAADHATGAPCPHCEALAPFEAHACPACGLVFASQLPPSVRDIPRYTALRPLGAGGMSSVFLARDRAVGDVCALKVALGRGEAEREDQRRCLEREAWVLRHIQHPAVVQLLGWYPDHEEPFLATAYLPGPSLEQRLAGGALPLDEALRYAASAADAACHLAQLPQPVAHCDIKPANLVALPDGRAVLLDFGSALVLSGVAGGAAQGDHYGTPGYAAPEQYRRQAGPRSDVYGVAATLYHLATGDDPSSHPLAFPALGVLPRELRELLAAALSHDPAARPTPAELRDRLRALAARGRYPVAA